MNLPPWETHDRLIRAAGQAPAHTSLSAEKAQIVADERDRIWAGVDELDGQALSGVSYVDEAAVYAVIYPKEASSGEAPAAPLTECPDCGHQQSSHDKDGYCNDTDCFYDTDPCSVSGEAPAAPLGEEA